MNDESSIEIADIIFTWDNSKAVTNWRKHKVDFRIAVEVFFDDDALDIWDLYHNEEEDRRNVIGKVYDPVTSEDILFVVYVERVSDDGKDVIRIISARPANRKERRLYEHNLS